MVLLTAVLAIRSRGPDPYWRRQLAKRLTWHFYGRSRNCYKLSLNRMRRALRNATEHRKLKRQDMGNLFETRIAAACAEHGVQYSPFITILRQNNIELSFKVLADLAIYEPRTFQSLCELVKRQHAMMLNSNLNPSARMFKNNLNPSSKIFTKGML